jgi:hypothetical protein
MMKPLALALIGLGRCLIELDLDVPGNVCLGLGHILLALSRALE